MMAEVGETPENQETPPAPLPLPGVSPEVSAEARPVAEATVDEPAPLWLRRGDQIVVAALVALGLGLLTVQAWRMGAFQGEVVDIERLPETALRYRLDVNRATWVEWSQLDGIGETLARRIVADREANGPFPSVDDLGRVKGLGPKTLDKIRPWLSLPP